MMCFARTHTTVLSAAIAVGRRAARYCHVIITLSGCHCTLSHCVLRAHAHHRAVHCRAKARSQHVTIALRTL
eukprot:2202615-Rhodomonas_salina.1